MMRPLSRYVAGAVILGLTLPSLSFAAPERGALMGARASGTPQAGANFCSRLDEIGTKLDERTKEREAKLDERRGERDAKIKDREGKRDGTRTGNRDGWDANRDELYKKLEARASTSDALAAVKTFESEVDAAVAARRAAVDKAVAEYRTALDKAVADRKAAVDAAIATFKSDRDAAMAQAKSDCAGGKTPADVRTAYMNAMKSAQEKLKTTLQGLDTKKDVLKPMAEARKADVEKAIADFKAAVEAAKTKLKAGWNLKENVK